MAKIMMHALMAKIMTKPASLPDDENQPGHLPRLTDAAYRGKAIVHWTLTVRDRGTGWLDARFTTRFRWLLLHACGRYAVDCPVHCLMPDHAHLLLHGSRHESDQRGMMRFLRRHTNELLAETGHRWPSPALPSSKPPLLSARNQDSSTYKIQ